jgi:hypothetical protein
MHQPSYWYFQKRERFANFEGESKVSKPYLKDKAQRSVHHLSIQFLVSFGVCILSGGSAAPLQQREL